MKEKLILILNQKKILLRELYYTPDRHLLQNIGEAFFIASLSLTLLKICGFLFAFLINVCLLLVITFYAYINNYYIQIQYLFIQLIKKIMPQHLFEIRDCTINDYLIEFEDAPELQKKWVELQNVRWYQKLSFSVFVLLIWLRLWFLLHPAITNLIVLSFIFMLLIVNSIKLLILIFVYKLHIVIRRVYVLIYLL